MGLFGLNSKQKQEQKEQAVRERIVKHIQDSFLKHFEKNKVEKSCNTSTTMGTDNAVIIQASLSGYPLGALPGTKLYEVRYARMPKVIMELAKDYIFDLCAKDNEVKEYVVKYDITIKVQLK